MKKKEENNFYSRVLLSFLACENNEWWYNSEIITIGARTDIEGISWFPLLHNEM